MPHTIEISSGKLSNLLFMYLVILIYFKDWLLWYGNKADSKFFERWKCPEKRCTITHHRNYMPVDQYDAVLFYLTRDAKDLPQKRSAKQLYVAGSY
jgi:hypothetical protein